MRNPKSTSAARVVKTWNPELKVEALEKGVGVTSEATRADKSIEPNEGSITT